MPRVHFYGALGEHGRSADFLSVARVGTAIGPITAYDGKPFSYPELKARVGALLRRTERGLRRGRLRVGALEIDPAGRTVLLNGRPVSISQKEFALLRTLAVDPTKVYPKDELLRNIWGYRALGSTRTLDSHACRLRQKLARDGDRFVVNVWGVGYRLVDGPIVDLADRWQPVEEGGA